MALQTKQLLNQDDGALTVNYTYDDVDLRIRQVDIVNTSARAYTISATRLTNGRNYTFTINPQTTINQAISLTVANRLQLITASGGKLDGVEWSVS